MDEREGFLKQLESVRQLAERLMTARHTVNDLIDEAMLANGLVRLEHPVPDYEALGYPETGVGVVELTGAHVIANAASDWIGFAVQARPWLGEKNSEKNSEKV